MRVTFKWEHLFLICELPGEKIKEKGFACMVTIILNSITWWMKRVENFVKMPKMPLAYACKLKRVGVLLLYCIL